MERTIKIVCLGDEKSGKSATISRIVDAKISNNYDPTIGGNFHTFNYQTDFRRIHINIWDTAGEERFRGLISIFIHDCDLILIFYDVKSTKKIAPYFAYWKNFISRQNLYDPRHIILVCNKVDQSDWTSNSEEITAFAVQEHIRVNFISAMIKIGINELKDNMINTIVQLNI